MRILHVSDCYAPRTGGIETQVRDLARAQVRAGHEVHVLTATPGPAGERGGLVTEDDGVQVHRLAARLPFDLPINPVAPPRMRALVRGLAPDVVHVHAGVVSPFAYDGARVARGERVPLAITWHCMLDGMVPTLRAAARLGGWRGAPAALSAVSAAAAERVQGVFGVPVGVVPNGMDLEEWRPGPGEASSTLRCVATMRLAPRKRGPALIAVVEDAMTQLEPGQLTVEVLGDGPSRSAMDRRVRRRGLGHVVTLRGRVSREEVRATYLHADVFVAPAVLEAFGIAALEARAAGLVVVARRGTGIEEFITHGVDGLLVDDDAGMARALVRLATEPGLLAALRGHARVHRPVQGWRVTLAAVQAEYARAAAQMV
jgi:glycosyltransferase involved in cell wall biosynthesis